MEKLTLKPQVHEIVVNNGAADGAIDLFSYTPDEAAASTLGSLYVIGHRNTDSSNVGYIVSLIGALARREYYAQPELTPREAFARTLRKANEVVEEFFRTGDVELSIGIIAIGGGTIMVSKLDKFKILLARGNQVIDILSNVALFSKDHGEKRKFSSVIHGSVQAGDRILAYVPTRAITARERNLKGWFLKLPQDEFAERVEQIGQQHAIFATAMFHIDVTQTVALTEIPVPEQATEVVPPQSDAGLAWAPRQSAPIVHHAAAAEPEPETPRIIASEFSRGTRQTWLSRLAGRVRIVRLDRRGKAVALASVAMIIICGALAARSLFFLSAQQRSDKQALQTIKQDFDLARTQLAQDDRSRARELLSRAFTALTALHTTSDDATALSAAITTALDGIDNAQAVTPTLLASPEPDMPAITIAAWASASHSMWIGGITEGAAWASPMDDQSIAARVSLGTGTIDTLIGYQNGVCAVNFTDRTVTRTVNGTQKSYTLPTQDTLLDVAEFGDNLYVLTDKGILKISDLNTEKPITKQWLASDQEFVSGAARIWVNGDIWTMSPDGTLVTYYKGKKLSQASTALAFSGMWRLTQGPDGLLAASSGTARRIYLIDPEDASLTRTLKLDSDAPYTYLSPGPDNSILLITSEGKLWQVQ